MKFCGGLCCQFIEEHQTQTLGNHLALQPGARTPSTCPPIVLELNYGKRFDKGTISMTRIWDRKSGVQRPRAWQMTPVEVHRLPTVRTALVPSTPTEFDRAYLQSRSRPGPAWPSQAPTSPESARWRVYLVASHIESRKRCTPESSAAQSGAHRVTGSDKPSQTPAVAYSSNETEHAVSIPTPI